MEKVTPDQCRDAVASNSIARASHHRCSGCGYMTGYVFERADLVYLDPTQWRLKADDLVVGYDAGCDCGSRGGGAPIAITTWSEFADSFNMQTPEGRAVMWDRFTTGKPTHDSD